MNPAAKKNSKPSAADMRLLRERLGLAKYRKTSPRDPAKKDILLELALRKIRKAEIGNFIPVGFRKRRVKFLAGP
jgi:hypothetical protein